VTPSGGVPDVIDETGFASSGFASALGIWSLGCEINADRAGNAA
jgi:hypothetical protein